MAEHKLIGKNYTLPDLVAKVTGKAKYAEDYRADGMLFCKLLLSPMPHARVRSIDASAALAMPGVKAILTADDLPEVAVGINIGATTSTALGERALTNEPLYEGEPILAVAAVDELTAAEAIEKIIVDLEPLPFVVDPIAALRPGSPNPRAQGNVWVQPPATAQPEGGRRGASQGGAPVAGRGGRGGAAAGPPPIELQELKWTEQDFADAGEGQLPMGKPTEEWQYGDLEAGFKDAAVVIDQSFVVPTTCHQPLEPRSAMAYWQNGKLYLHGGVQSTVVAHSPLSRWVGIPEENAVLITPFTGGGFGSKIPGFHAMAIPALLSRKANAPVMMRISREEEHYIGRARAGVHGRVRVGFRQDGRITALDMYTVCDGGAYDLNRDGAAVGRIASLIYQPLAMRFRTIDVVTNTPSRTSQRSPGGMQANAIMEPVVSQGARKLGIDQVEIRRINAAAGKAPMGPAQANGKRAYVSSSFVREALDRGAALFKWDEKKASSGKRNGSKVRGIGVAVGTFNAGGSGLDGLFVIKPDGRLTIQSGIGNLGSHNVFDVHRVVAEILDIPWEICDIAWGNTAKHLPWTCRQSGSSTTHAMTRAAHAAAMDAKQKLQQIAAKDLGGRPDDYAVGNARVFRKGSPSSGMSFAQAAKRAIALGGIYDGHELPDNINAYTKRSATALAGQGLMAVAKDAYSVDGGVLSSVAGFAEVEVDVETGVYRILEYTAVADCGTVMHPRNLGGQIFGGSMLGMGHALGQKWVYDQHYGKALAKRFLHNKPPTILDAPQTMLWDALDIPDPETPVGARGIGEPPVGAGFGAVLNALTDALGDEVFRRAPVTADMILASLEAGKVVHEALTAYV